MVCWLNARNMVGGGDAILAGTPVEGYCVRRNCETRCMGGPWQTLKRDLKCGWSILEYFKAYMCWLRLVSRTIFAFDNPSCGCGIHSVRISSIESDRCTFMVTGDQKANPGDISKTSGALKSLSELLECPFDRVSENPAASTSRGRGYVCFGRSCL